MARLRPYKHILRQIGNRAVSLKKRRQALINQKGGKFWNGLTTVVKTCCRQRDREREREMAYQKMYMVLAEDPAMVNLFKGRLTIDPTLDTAAKLLTRKMEILKNPNTSHGFKKQAIKQIDPDIELYVKKMRQLPASLSVDADPTKLVKSLKDEGDFVTPVQQKLLKRIFSEVSPKREPTTTTTPLKPSRIPVKIPKKQTPSKNVSWDELPFAQEGPEADLEGALIRTMKKMKRTPRLVNNLRPAKGWTSWDPSGIKKEETEKFYFKHYRFRCQKIGV